jgi:RimJ/RimL family protein N-acetyltransferase
MPDITIVDFPPNRLACLVHWRNDPVGNRYVRPGLRTLEAVQDWYTQYFSHADNQLFALHCDETLIGYCTLEHIDLTNSHGEIGLVIGNPAYWHQGLGTLVVTQLTTLALTTYHLHRVCAVIQGGNRASMRCFEKAGFQHEGTCREARYSHGACLDLHYYAMFAQEWRA